METVIQMFIGLFAGMVGFAAYAFGLAFLLFFVCGGFYVIGQEIYQKIKNKFKTCDDQQTHE